MTHPHGTPDIATREVVVAIGAELSHQRADRAIAQAYPELSRRAVQSLCERGQISRDGRALRKSELVRTGDRITIELDAPLCASPSPDAHLHIRLESPHWIVVAKPAGQPTAPTRVDEQGALANALVAHYPELAGIGHHALEPGLLHRLDNGTSGLVVAARTPESFQIATQALKQGRWRKHYLALVQGTGLPSAGVIHGQLTADRRHPQRVQLAGGPTLCTSDTRYDWDSPVPANPSGEVSLLHETRFRVLREHGQTTYVEVAVKAAFRHQIRAHFASAGWPLVNDAIYGATANPRLAPRRHALHAARVAWAGAGGFEGFDVFEPLPDDLSALLDESLDSVP